MAIVKKYSLDYEQAKRDLIEHFKNQSRYSDWDFDQQGSALNLLMDILAYNTSQNSFVANRLASETMIDTVQKRSNAVSIGNTLGGYLPKSAQSSRATVNVSVNSFGDSGTPEFVFMSSGQKFTSEEGFNFYTIEDQIAYPNSSGTAVFQEIEIYEGRRVAFESDGTDNGFVIASDRVDLSTLNVYIDDRRASQIGKDVDIGDVGSEDLVYSVKERFDGRYEVSFGDGVFGLTTTDSNVIKVDYVIAANLDDANGYSVFDTDTVETYSDITITSVTKSSSGARRESVDSIRRYAPLHFSAANRAVTVNDYKYLIENNFPFVKAASVWGGEELDNKNFGQVYISLIDSNDEIPTTSQKNAIKKFLEGFNIASVTSNFIDPTNIDLYPVIRIVLDPKEIDFNVSTAKSIVAGSIDRYGESLRGFSKEYSKTDLTNSIEEDLPGIKYMDVETGINRAFNATQTSGSQINFDMPLYHPYKGYAKEKDGVILSTAIKDPKTGIEYFLNDDGEGNVRRYFVDSVTGKRTYVNNSQGTIDYSTGLVKIVSFNGFSTAEFTMRATPDRNIISSSRDSSLRLTSQNAVVIIEVNL